MRAPLFALLSLAACVGPGNPGDTDDPCAEDPWAAGCHPKALPFEYERPETGEPIDDAELAALTERYLELLDGTRYFEILDERTHGWPESDPQGRYWYGSWWSGVSIVKQDGRVTYLHSADGADNNGLRTAEITEGACYAAALWGDQGHERLYRETLRAMVAWGMAMERWEGDADGEALLSRAHYPEPVTSTDGGRELFIDYSLNRPGLDNGATGYVHVPDNPHWGDIYVKNKRSKDDIGHMLRALSQADTCAGILSSDADDDLAEARARYSAWASRVEEDGWRIATWDANLEYWLPDESLAVFWTTGDIECDALLALRLMGHLDPGDLACGSGVSSVDDAILATGSSNTQIAWTMHEAAANLALLSDEPEVARVLLEGLAARMDAALDAEEAGEPLNELNDEDLGRLVIHSANTGVPLTWREVRRLHELVDEANAGFLADAEGDAWHVFDASVPDGDYGYDLGGHGLDFKTLGALLGTCAAQYRNPASKPVLDCGMVAAWTPGGS